MGRVPGRPSDRKYQVSHLWQAHHEILRLLLLGYKPKEIASTLNITPQTVGNIRNSELGQIELGLMRSQRNESAVDMAQMIREEAKKSFEFLQECREGMHEDVGINKRIDVAMSMMDREPTTAKVRRLEGQVMHGHFTADEIKNLKIEAQAAAQEDSKMVKAEIVEAEVVMEGATG